MNVYLLFLGKVLHLVGEEVLEEAHPTLEELFANLTVAIKYAEEAIDILWCMFLLKNSLHEFIQNIYHLWSFIAKLIFFQGVT